MSLSSMIRLGRKLLPSGTPSSVFARGSVVEKCTPKQPRAVKKMKLLQTHYQNEEDKRPIFLKGGAKDQILYRFTMLLCGISLGWQGYNYYHMANPGS